MTCAGFLVVANRAAAFVEICTGVLVCRYDADAVSNPQDGALPPLEPRRMAKLEVCTHSTALKMEKTQQPEDELEPEPQNDTPDTPKQRLMQLSGYLVEVLDQDLELDELSLPHSFQVNTFKLTLQPDGSSSSKLNDSLVLTATDAEAKKTWVKNIKFWNRYGWRDTVYVAAERSDLTNLQQMLQHDNNYMPYPRFSSAETYSRQQNSLLMSGGRNSYAGHSSCATRRQSRRRFYRTAIPGTFAPPS